ncbi:putative cinnamoyl-CoA reductase [Biscogniauxia marginata]|nr:putative cinnamoyl-CoA reductase [Biscogniauxia marginata]
MSSPNVLLTGATGFIGFKVLVSLLEEGYSVRTAIRSISQSESLASHPKVKALGVPDNLSFIEVPDITCEGAYDQAIKGVTYVIHLASPLPVTNILNSVHKEQSVKKLVITSSVFANIPFPPDPTTEITALSRVSNIPGPYASMLPAYSAGKIAVLNATDKFIVDNNPSFTIVNVFPGFVFGHDDRAQSLSALTAGTNRILVPIITGQSAADPMPAGVTHVDDAAKVHMLALKDGVSGNLGVVKPYVFDDAWDVVQKHFPKAVAVGTFSRGQQPTIPVNWNAHQTEVEVGFNFKTYEDMVIDIAGQYLELAGKEKA